MMISDLPVELQSKIMFYTLEHPCARMIKDECTMHYHETIENCGFNKCYFSSMDWVPYYCHCCQKYGRLINWRGERRTCRTCYKKTEERRFNKRLDHTYFCPLFRSLFREWKQQYKLTKLKKP